MFIKALGVRFGYSVTVQPLPHLRSPHTERTGKLFYEIVVWGPLRGGGLTGEAPAKMGRSFILLLK